MDRLNLLLDTHAFLWWWEGKPRLPAKSREAIDGAETVYVSLASAWEVAIKASQGRLRLALRFEDGIAESGFKTLPIAFPHIERVAGLPLHHRDPFDRMLIAQAQTEGLTLVSADRHFERYDVKVIWA